MLLAVVVVGLKDIHTFRIETSLNTFVEIYKNTNNVINARYYSVFAKYTSERSRLMCWPPLPIRAPAICRNGRDAHSERFVG